jgi:uncharacterized ferritin-like protein (DUF455 family)
MTSAAIDPDRLRPAARAAWALRDPREKCEAVARLAAWGAGRSSTSAPSPSSRPAQVSASDDALEASPGRPARPRLVAPADLPRRSMTSVEGRAALLHAIAHIEFNAINLALDAAWRFRDVPAEFCTDWLAVAADEARHFTMLQSLLRARGFAYGDFDAHDGLWEMAERTRANVLDRMALVPRLLEARGLDATPPIQAKLRQAGDAKAADVLAVILREEVGHVAIGNRWFAWLCARQGVEPAAAFEQACRRHRAPGVRGPINREARLAAGFSEQELDAMASRGSDGAMHRVPDR